MQNYNASSRTYSQGRMATRMERLINESGIFKTIRDENAGFRSAPKWRKRYKLTGSNYYLYLMFDETYHIQNGKNGPFVLIEDFIKNSSKEVQELMNKLAELGKEIHEHKEE